MKHIALKSLLSVALSLMMLVVFIPTIAFADEPEATDEPQAVQPVDESEFTDEVVEADDVEETEAPVDISQYGATITEKNDGMFGFDQLSRVRKASGAKSGYTDIVLSDVTNEYEYDTAYESSVAFERTDENINGYYCIQQVEANKGVVCLEYTHIGSTDATKPKPKIAFFYDAACKKAVDGVVTVSPTTSYDYCFKIPKTGSYYLAVGASASGWSDGSYMELSFYAQRFPQAKKGTTLKDGQYYAVRCGKGKTTTFKYKPTNVGLSGIFTGTSYGQSTVTLKSKSGKTLASQSNRYYYPYFGVKKTTYKVSVKLYKKSPQRGYIVSPSNQNYSNQSGSSKKKAATLNQGQYMNGRIVAGSKKSQWFKFTTTEAAMFNLEVNGRTNNKIKFQLYKGKTLQKKWTSYVKNYTGFNASATQLMPAGTYYVKVTPVKKSCGAYTIIWNYAY